jgi:aerobic carbon-monoxide dehydrogenase medium subunit
MIPAAFDYIAPGTLDEAMRALAAHGEDAKLLAGGHSLLPLLKLRLANPKLLIDLGRIPGLSAISRQNDRVVIGALATHYQIESSELLKKSCPLLPETAREIGDVQVRNRGTIGGTLAHADPSADWPATILALGAEIRLRGSRGERRLAAEEFFLGPLTTVIEPDEILTEIRVPVLQKRCGGAYLKRAQQASGFAIVGVAVSLRVDAKGFCEEISVGVTGLGDKPFRARAVEARLRGNKLTRKLIDASAVQVAEGIAPLEDLHAAAPFRAHLAQVYAARAIEAAAKRAAGKSR